MVHGIIPFIVTTDHLSTIIPCRLCSTLIEAVMDAITTTPVFTSRVVPTIGTEASAAWLVALLSIIQLPAIVASLIVEAQVPSQVIAVLAIPSRVVAVRAARLTPIILAILSRVGVAK